RPYEDECSRGVVGEQRERQCDKATPRDKEADEGEGVQHPHVRGLDDPPPEVELRTGPGATARFEDGRLPEQLRGERCELCLVAGVSSHPIECEILVERHLETLVRVQLD